MDKRLQIMLSDINNKKIEIQNAIENDKERAAKIVKVMYGQACLMAGQPLDDPVEYSDLVLSMM